MSHSRNSHRHRNVAVTNRESVANKACSLADCRGQSESCSPDSLVPKAMGSESGGSQAFTALALMSLGHDVHCGNEIHNEWLSETFARLPALRDTGTTARDLGWLQCYTKYQANCSNRVRTCIGKGLGWGGSNTGRVSRLLALKPQLCTYWLKPLRQDSTSFFSPVNWEYIAPLSKGCCEDSVNQYR